MFGISIFMVVLLIFLIIGVMSCCYIFFGGLKVVVLVDVIYGIGLIFGGFFIVILGIFVVG